MKWFIVFSTVSIVCAAASMDDFRIIDMIFSEPPCTRVGGMCTIAEDCPYLSEERGLCPEQKSQGVECCYGFSVKETRCRKRGGECLPPGAFCRHSATYKEATDCPKDAICCILVNK